ncbi:hypothetical protein MPTK1_1g28160 [Marchantia polymorpha subsp. ruderalis]|uniref:PGG domain-containing protein n=2 Tax=Marchantia polymorpha TaxID=3197 RepID=A0AAF6AV52_MARPO|nr:hypothetical protein MARPO_0002s0062 [Marchantia polymorpha]BBN00323.1 hypothetical protein Mp_1g28160 [Marchantia polymorpha subsp. ruderalis]|eukprot:PTQ49560.1 hypothetical protein MARPO_0002s0062 [Marchantia polymorpha]
MSLCRAVLSGDANEVRSVLFQHAFDLSERVELYNGGTALHIAVIENRVEILECLLDDPSGLKLINLGDDFSLRPLHYACSLSPPPRSHCACSLAPYPRIQVLKSLLLCDEVDLACRAYNAATPLHVAAYAGNDEAVELLLGHPRWMPSFVEARTNLEKFTALHIAASKGFEKIVRLVLNSEKAELKKKKKKKQVEMIHAQKDRLWRRPLHYAAWENQVKVVKEMLENWKSVDVNAVDVDGYTALHLAAKRGYVSIVQMMLDHRGLDLDVVTNSSQIVHERMKLVEQKEDIMRSALRSKDSHFAAEIEAALPELGLPKLGDSVFRDEAGKMMSLHCAVEQSHDEVVTKLLSSKKLKLICGDAAFNISIAVIIQYSQERSAADRDATLDALVVSTHQRILRGLFGKLHEHKDTNYKVPNLKICQDLVGSSNIAELPEMYVLDLLLDEDLRSTLVTTFKASTRSLRAPSGGVTLMHMITYTGYDQTSLLKCVLAFPQMEELINADDNDGRTPLHYAILAGQSSSVQLLIDMPKLRLNKADKEGRSPIELAVKTRHTDIQQMLLEKPVVREYVQQLYMDRQMYVDATNAILVGAGIIASVTFPGWLDPPLEDYEENRLLPTARSILSHKSFNKVTGTNPQVFEVFWICNSMSFFFAVACALGGAGALLPSSHAFVRKQVIALRRSVIMTSVLLTFAIVFVLGAFGAAGFATLPPVLHMQTSTLISCAVGTCLCLAVLILFLIRLYNLVGNRSIVQMRRVQWPTASHRNWRELLTSFLPGNSSPRSDLRAPLLPRVSRSGRFL